MKVQATNIISPLGRTTEENFQAVKAGRSALRLYEHQGGIPEPFVASLFSEEQKAALAIPGYTRLESLCIHSVQEALGQRMLPVASDRVIFILSSTKGNVELLEHPDGFSEEHLQLNSTAQHIAQAVGIQTIPLVVCNACISGVSAQVLALRLLRAGLYDWAIVCGADVQSKFIISGFQSLKAVSDEECRPFDMERTGLNLGEAAATIIYSRESATSEEWELEEGVIRNDAFHISSPSKDGEGCYRALTDVLEGFDRSQLGAISAHGTATLYNDQMESKAIERAGLGTIPISALKGYYGHTMGAAGVLETILMMKALEEGFVPGIRGFEERGVSGKISLSAQPVPTTKKVFVKLLSGFGGCNGAILLKKGGPTRNYQPVETKVLREIHLSGEDLTTLYKEQIGSYPKFYKMDKLSRLAFVATELLLKDVPAEEHRGVIFFNKTASLHTDRQYQDSIREDDYYPSPSVFVYTLPNICMGEVAIRQGLRGETSFYVLDSKEDTRQKDLMELAFQDSKATSFVSGWIDYADDTNWEADLKLITRK